MWKEEVWPALKYYPYVFVERLRNKIRNHEKFQATTADPCAKNGT
jgi:hypothetical protein